MSVPRFWHVRRRQLVPEQQRYRGFCGIDLLWIITVFRVLYSQVRLAAARNRTACSAGNRFFCVDWYGVCRSRSPYSSASRTANAMRSVTGTSSRKMIHQATMAAVATTIITTIARQSGRRRTMVHDHTAAAATGRRRSMVRDRTATATAAATATIATTTAATRHGPTAVRARAAP
jgi:hypothetical protein